VTDIRWLTVEYNDSGFVAGNEKVARAAWIARTVSSSTAWPALTKQIPSAREPDGGLLTLEPSGRMLPDFWKFEIVAYSAPWSGKTLGPATRRSSLVVRFRPQPRAFLSLDESHLGVPSNLADLARLDDLSLSGEDDESAAKLIAAVKLRFGEGPGVPKGWNDRFSKFSSKWSDEKAPPTSLPTREQATQRSPSPTPKQDVKPAEEPKKPTAATPRKRGPAKAPKPPTTSSKRVTAEAPKPAATSRSAVFISYSHQDRRWLARLQTHLKPLQRQGHIDLWDDTRIRAGDEWRKEIEQAIASCKIAILLISPDFMASDFIDHSELPPLLEKAKNRGVRILSIIVSPSSYEDSELARYQAINPPSKPLRALERWEQDKVFVQVHREVKQALTTSS
jgi:hypothetical protein